jgi:putative hydrolase of the HAD superfamily
MAKIEHVFFDLDHTLWDFEKNSDLTFQKIFKKQNIDINLEEFLAVYKPLNLEFWRLYREEKITKSELRYQRLKKAFDAIQFSISDDLIDALAIDYINYLPHFNHLFDGTLNVLEYLKPKYQLHIITNGFEEIQSKKMASSNILNYFNAVITSESVGVKKPNAKVFEHALQKAGATKDNSIMIGDSIEADVYGAMNVGIKAIHCNFDDKEVLNTDFISITSLDQIKQHL